MAGARRAGGHDRSRGQTGMRWLALAATALVLSGCALPPVVTVASFALDFASYGATGKTVTDHGISAVLQRDCALLRSLDEGEVCRDDDYDFAGERPPRNEDTPAARRVAALEEESNRVNSGAVAAAVAQALQVAYSSDSNIAPERAQPQQAKISKGWLGTDGYLRDDSDSLL